jgi:hypothetical protein
MSDSSTPHDGSTTLEVGSRVEVHNAFEGGWSRGFTVEAAEGDGFRLRRSDGVVLPTIFPANEVRPEKKRSMWWM